MRDSTALNAAEQALAALESDLSDYVAFLASWSGDLGESSIGATIPEQDNFLRRRSRPRRSRILLTFNWGDIPTTRPLTTAEIDSVLELNLRNAIASYVLNGVSACVQAWEGELHSLDLFTSKMAAVRHGLSSRLSRMVDGYAEELGLLRALPDLRRAVEQELEEQMSLHVVAAEDRFRLFRNTGIQQHPPAPEGSPGCDDLPKARARTKVFDLSNAKERRAAVEEYCNLRSTPEKPFTKTDFWKQLGYETKFTFECWQRMDMDRRNRRAEQLFRAELQKFLSVK